MHISTSWPSNSCRNCNSLDRHCCRNHNSATWTGASLPDTPPSFPMVMPLAPSPPMTLKMWNSSQISTTLIKDYINMMDVRIHLGIHTVMLILNQRNLYLQSSGLGKALMTENPTWCARVILINCIYMLSALIYPIMPATSVHTGPA